MQAGFVNPLIKAGKKPKAGISAQLLKDATEKAVWDHISKLVQKKKRKRKTNFYAKSTRPTMSELQNLTEDQVDQLRRKNKSFFSKGEKFRREIHRKRRQNYDYYPLPAHPINDVRPNPFIQ